MKHIRTALISLCLLCALPAPFLTTSCMNTTQTQATKYKTLAAVGAAAQAAMDSTTALLKAGKIPVAQFQKVADYFDGKFQPSFRFAVATAKADLSTLASPDITTLLAQFTTLVAEVSK